MPLKADWPQWGLSNALATFVAIIGMIFGVAGPLFPIISEWPGLIRWLILGVSLLVLVVWALRKIVETAGVAIYRLRCYGKLYSYAEHTKSQSDQERHYVEGTQRDADRAVFQRLRGFFSDEDLYQLREQNYMDSFQIKWHRGLRDYVEECFKADFEFNDRELNDLRIDLLGRINSFLSNVIQYTFTLDRNTDWAGVPAEWEEERPKEFWRTVKALNDGATSICNAYNNLVRIARKKGL